MRVGSRTLGLCLHFYGTDVNTRNLLKFKCGHTMFVLETVPGQAEEDGAEGFQVSFAQHLSEQILLL